MSKKIKFFVTWLMMLACGVVSSTAMGSPFDGNRSKKLASDVSYKNPQSDFSEKNTSNLVNKKATKGLPCKDRCQLTIQMADSWGDGWNDAVIYVEQGGDTIDAITLEAGSTGSTYLYLCPDSAYFHWSQGGYPEEVSFVIYDVDGTQLYACIDGSSLTDGAVFFTSITCQSNSCIMPTNFSIVEKTKTSATMSWQHGGEETAWNLIISDSVLTYEQYSKVTPIAMTDTFYTVQNLTQGRIYWAYLQADCGSGKGSFWQSIVLYTDTVAIHFKEITLDYKESGLYADNARMMVNPKTSAVYPTLAYKFTLTDTTRIRCRFNSDDISIYSFCISYDSTFNYIIDGNFYSGEFPDTTYYVLFYTKNQSDDYMLWIEREKSYHELDYSKELTLGTIENGTISIETAPYVETNEWSGYATGYQVALEKGKTYTLTMTSYAQQIANLQPAISLLTPDTFHGKYYYWNEDLKNFNGNSDDNHSEVTTIMQYTADTTANYRLLLQNWQKIKTACYSILVEEVDAKSDTITFDSLLRAADALNYDTDLPYMTYGQFILSQPLVLSDTLFRTGNSGLYYAAAYRVDLKTGDSLIADFGGSFDSYLYLYASNGAGGYILIDSEDDTYGDREQIVYKADTVGIYYVVPTSYDPYTIGNWTLKIVNSSNDLTADISEIEVTLAANPSKLSLDHTATEEEVALALRNVQLIVYDNSNSIFSLYNNPYRWTVDMAHGKASYSCTDNDLPLGYTFKTDTVTVTVTWDGSTAVSQIVVDKKLSLYPNPAIDHITLSGLSALESVEQLQIYDLSGRVVLSKNLNGSDTETLNISTLVNGIYQVRIGSQVMKLIVRQ